MHDLPHAPDSHCLMVVKLDMEREYDLMRWSFLERALHKFHDIWIR